MGGVELAGQTYFFETRIKALMQLPISIECFTRSLQTILRERWHIQAQFWWQDMILPPYCQHASLFMPPPVLPNYGGCEELKPTALREA